MGWLVGRSVRALISLETRAEAPIPKLLLEHLYFSKVRFPCKNCNAYSIRIMHMKKYASDGYSGRSLVQWLKSPTVTDVP